MIVSNVSSSHAQPGKISTLFRPKTSQSIVVTVSKPFVAAKVCRVVSKTNPKQNSLTPANGAITSVATLTSPQISTTTTQIVNNVDSENNDLDPDLVKLAETLGDDLNEHQADDDLLASSTDSFSWSCPPAVSSELQSRNRSAKVNIPVSKHLGTSCFADIRLKPCSPVPLHTSSEDVDDDLTNLNWLNSRHVLAPLGQYLDSANITNPVKSEPEQHLSPTIIKPRVDGIKPRNEVFNPSSPFAKPPYSFSSLIFLAIESSRRRCLPVKEVYNWILDHFPYFRCAPLGWKNSVRHNLSLNKCFKKVDRQKSQILGKGSLWCVDEEYRASLLSSLKKTPYNTPNSFLANTMQTLQETIEELNPSSLSANSTAKSKKSSVPSIKSAEVEAAEVLALFSKISREKKRASRRDSLKYRYMRRIIRAKMRKHRHIRNISVNAENAAPIAPYPSVDHTYSTPDDITTQSKSTEHNTSSGAMSETNEDSNSSGNDAVYYSDSGYNSTHRSPKKRKRKSKSIDKNDWLALLCSKTPEEKRLQEALLNARKRRRKVRVDDIITKPNATPIVKMDDIANLLVSMSNDNKEDSDVDPDVYVDVDDSGPGKELSIDVSSDLDVINCKDQEKVSPLTRRFDDKTFSTLRKSKRKNSHSNLKRTINKLRSKRSLKSVSKSNKKRVQKKVNSIENSSSQSRLTGHLTRLEKRRILQKTKRRRYNSDLLNDIKAIEGAGALLSLSRSDNHSKLSPVK